MNLRTYGTIRSKRVYEEYGSSRLSVVTCSTYTRLLLTLFISLLTVVIDFISISVAGHSDSDVCSHCGPCHHNSDVDNLVTRSPRLCSGSRRSRIAPLPHIHATGSSQNLLLTIEHTDDTPGCTHVPLGTLTRIPIGRLIYSCLRVSLP